jgi:hypothetical protein
MFMLSPSLMALQLKYSEQMGGRDGTDTSHLALKGPSMESSALPNLSPVDMMDSDSGHSYTSPSPAVNSRMCSDVEDMQQQRQLCMARTSSLAAPCDDDTFLLYQELIKSKGIATAHHSSSDRGTDLPHDDDKAQKQSQLRSTLDELEDLWVSSGQAALTPSRQARDREECPVGGARSLTPSRSSRLTPSR